MKFLIVGLGNIGIEYAETRHNIGFDVLDVFVRKHQGIFKNDRLADVAEIKYKGRQIICIKPTTYMNLSGKAFKYWMDKEKIPVEQTLTIVDDIAFPLHVIKLKPGGSDAGHNGLKNIQACIGTAQYPKLRFGIGNQFSKGKQVDFVLGKWKDSEIPLVNQKVDACTTIIENFTTMGITLTMNFCNNLKFDPIV